MNNLKALIYLKLNWIMKNDKTIKIQPVDEIQLRHKTIVN